MVSECEITTITSQQDKSNLSQSFLCDYGIYSWCPLITKTGPLGLMETLVGDMCAL